MSQPTQKKTVKPTAAAATPAAAAAPAPVVAAAPAAAAVAAPAKKATKTAKVEVAASAPATAAPAKVAAPTKAVDASSVTATATETAATTETPAVASHEELETLANELIKMAKRVLEVSRAAKKEFAKQVKKAEQGGKKRRVKADGESTHSNSVFLQPSKISPALAKFCGVAADQMLSRTDATRKIAAYIKEHNLQNPDNRREILSDATLISLFALTSEDKLNYFNLQRYIKPHFIKEVKTVA